jgi:AraC-like DNA-binding protein
MMSRQRSYDPCVDVVIRTDLLPAGQRLSYLRQRCLSLPEPVEITSTEAAVPGSLTRFREAGPASIGSLHTHGPVDWTIRRGPVLIRRGDPESFRLLLNVDGVTGMDQHGRQTQLDPVQMALYDTSTPLTGWRRTPSAPGTLLMMMFPYASLGHPPRRVRALIGTPVAGRRGYGALVAQTLVRLERDADQFSAEQLAAGSRAVLELLRALLGSLQDGGEPPRGDRAALMTQIEAYVNQRLGDRLTPAGIAAAHHISVRTLHRLFAERGRAVGQWIHDLRLDRCRRELAAAGGPPRTIQMLAQRWGFADGPHLSRSFRAAYGLSPHEFRELMRQTGPSVHGGDTAVHH